MDHKIALKTEIRATVTKRPTRIANEIDASWHKMKLMFMCRRAHNNKWWWVFHTPFAYAEVTNITMVKSFIKLTPTKKTFIVGVIRCCFKVKELEWVSRVGSVVCFWKKLGTFYMEDGLALNTCISTFRTVCSVDNWKVTHFAHCQLGKRMRLSSEKELEWMFVSVGVFRKNKWGYFPRTKQMQLEITY